MDKILSAEEWANAKGMTQWNDRKVQDYSIYLLEAFAGEVKSKAKVTTNEESTSIIVDKQSIDQLLTKFKEKL